MININSWEGDKSHYTAKNFTWNRSLKWKTAKFHKNFKFQSKISKMNELNVKLSNFIGSKIRQK